MLTETRWQKSGPFTATQGRAGMDKLPVSTEKTCFTLRGAPKSQHTFWMSFEQCLTCTLCVCVEHEGVMVCVC